MKFFIDTANLDQIKEAQDMGILDGVTTNPSLMAKEGITGEKNIIDFVHYLNFKVANPIIAKMIEIIQNLITTVDSGQPFFSK